MLTINSPKSRKRSYRNGQRMEKLRSSSSSSLSFYLSFNNYLLYYLLTFSSIYLVYAVPNANGFNPLIQLPSNGLFTNTSPAQTVTLNIDDFGAKGDAVTDDSKILRDVWNVACSSTCRAKIVIPAGKFYLIHPINFAGHCKSEVTLRISGTIIAPQDPDVWKGLDVHRWLYFHQVKNLKVEGGGVINGMGWKWWAQSCKTNESNPCTHAPTAITFHRCTNLKVRHVSIYAAQQMHVAFTNCKDVAVSNVTAITPASSPNTDGIHISSSTRVELKDIVVSTGDDCVSIVGNSSKIRINNMVCGPGHGISIGSLGKHNSTNAVQDVIVDGATLFSTENGVRIKTWQGGSGFVRKITFQNIVMWNVSNPIIIDQYYCDSRVPCHNQTSAVSIESISFRNIKGNSATEEAIIFSCSDTYPCKKLYLEDINLSTLFGTAKSICWEAYGTTKGLIYPDSCISSGEFVIGHNVDSKSNLTYWTKDGFAIF